MVKGVIFDFDGTIVDSEIPRLRSINEVLKDYNYKISEEVWNLNFKRFRTIDIFEFIKKEKKFDYNSYEMYKKSHFIREEMEGKGVRVIEGFFDFYNFLYNNKVKMIIASGGRKEHIKMLMRIDNLPDIDVIGREDYKNGKPNPDCYVLALKKLKLKSKEVIIFDDSVSGIEAGIKTGCKVIATNSYGKDIDELNIFMKIKNYNELNFEDFLNY